MIRALSLNDWYYVLAITAFACTAALFVYRKAALPAFRYGRARLKRVSTAFNSVEAIEKQMFPNGGSSMRDVVDRTSTLMKEMAKDVSMSVAQNRSLFEQSEVGMFEGDDDGEIVWANRALRQLTGMRLEQLVGSGWINAVHDEDRRRVENDWRLATAQRRPFIAMFRLTHIRTGAIVEVYCESYPVVADGGMGAGWLGLIRTRDIDAA